MKDIAWYILAISLLFGVLDYGEHIKRLDAIELERAKCSDSQNKSHDVLKETK